jgi:hypothetical protein
MGTNPPGPLGDRDYDDIKARMKDLEEAERQIDKAMNAGLDVTAQREQAKQLRAQLTRIKQTYFPNKP